MHVSVSVRTAIPLAMIAMALGIATARADVVMPEPESCPPGSIPRTAHSGPFCAPAPECIRSTECASGESCIEVSQCVETRGCGGLEVPDAAPCTLEHVSGACSGEGTCEGAATCRARRVCTGEAFDPDQGCSCRAPGRPARRRAVISIGLGLAALVLVRRRRR